MTRLIDERLAELAEYTERDAPGWQTVHTDLMRSLLSELRSYRVQVSALTEEEKTLREVALAVIAFDPTEAAAAYRENDEQPTCLDCNGEYAIRSGDDPTPFCDACAHAMVKRMAVALLATGAGK